MESLATRVAELLRIRKNLYHDDETRLAKFRFVRETVFLNHVIDNTYKIPLTISLHTIPKHRVSLQHLQDLCNKATALYWHQLDTEDRCPSTFDLKAFLLQQWTKCNLHSTDIEFKRFLAKTIIVRTPKTVNLTSSPTIQTIVRKHFALCQEFENRSEDFLNCCDPNKTYLINQFQLEHYRIKPLFLALIIIAEPEWPGLSARPVGDRCSFQGNRPVKLVRTGCTTGLSAPILFGEIGAAQTEMLGDIEIVSTTMAEAVRFIMGLDHRESLAFPKTEKEEQALDLQLGSFGYITLQPEPGHEEPTVLKRLQESYGFEGNEIIGPSTNWLPEKDTIGDFMRFYQLQASIPRGYTADGRMEVFHQIFGDREIAARMKTKRLREESELKELKNRLLDCELPFSGRNGQEGWVERTEEEVPGDIEGESLQIELKVEDLNAMIVEC